jgi:PAS domain S-box-containing protein
MDDIITYWNRGAEERYGWKAEQVVGEKTTHELLQTVFPASLDEINAELLLTGRWEGELLHGRADGTQVVVASRWSLQRDQRRRPLAIMELNNDVTERKRAEEGLRHAQLEPAHVTRVATMGELTASIAHEVNQPPPASRSTATRACGGWPRIRPTSTKRAPPPGVWSVTASEPMR